MRRSTGPDFETRFIVASRARAHCERCGADGDYWLGLDVHHRKPRRMGGTRDPEINSPANLVLLCRRCHNDVESHRSQAIADGWIIPMGSDPGATPVNLPGFGPTFLTKEGEYVVMEDENG